MFRLAGSQSRMSSSPLIVVVSCRGTKKWRIGDRVSTTGTENRGSPHNRLGESDAIPGDAEPVLRWCGEFVAGRLDRYGTLMASLAGSAVGDDIAFRSRSSLPLLGRRCRAHRAYHLPRLSLPTRCRCHRFRMRTEQPQRVQSQKDEHASFRKPSIVTVMNRVAHYRSEG